MPKVTGPRLCAPHLLLLLWMRLLSLLVLRLLIYEWEGAPVTFLTTIVTPSATKLLLLYQVRRTCQPTQALYV